MCWLSESEINYLNVNQHPNYAQTELEVRWGGGIQRDHNTCIAMTHLAHRFWLSKRWKIHRAEAWQGAAWQGYSRCFWLYRTSLFGSTVSWVPSLRMTAEENTTYALGIFWWSFKILEHPPPDLQGRGRSFLYSLCPLPLLEIPVQIQPSCLSYSAEPC